MRIRVLSLAACLVPALLGGAVRTDAAADAAPVPAARAPQTVRLITGEVVQVSSDRGRPRLVTSPRTQHGVARNYSVRHQDGDTYVVPAVASRYLGSVLDPGLFDVTAAARARVSPTAVTLTVATGSDPVVPGVTVTARSGNTWHARVDAADRFGAALAEQSRADALARRTSTVLFGGITRVSAPGITVARPPAHPSFPQQTLTAKVLDPAGRPADFATLELVNVDDDRKFATGIDVVDGVAKVSVPTGHYAGLLDYSRMVGDGFATYLVPVEGITVGDHGATAVFDARTATTVPSVHTPRPARAVSLILNWYRGTGDRLWYYNSLDPSAPIHVAPTEQAGPGHLDWVTSWTLAGSPTTGAPYTYDLSYDDSGLVPADQRRVVAPGQLAQVDARYYSDGGARPGSFGRNAIYPFTLEDDIEAFTFGLGTPLRRTEYVSAPVGIPWFGTLSLDDTDDGHLIGAVDDENRVYQAGTTQRVDWLRGPIWAGFAQATPSDRVYYCRYCRDETSILLYPNLQSDTNAGHGGGLFADDTDALTRFRIYRNGTLLDDTTGGDVPPVTVPANSATYRAVIDAHRGRAGFGSSTDTTTDVTFVSSSTSGNAPPVRFRCLVAGSCTVLPALTSSVPLPTDLTGTMRQGPVPLTVHVGHVVGAADPRITSVSLAVTVDDGRSFQPAEVTALDDHDYRVTLSNPASSAGRKVGVRLTVTDAAGGRLVQTARAAYTVAR